MEFGRKRLFDVLGFGVIVIWLVMMGLLVKDTYFKPAPVTLSTYQDSSSVEESETWMAIYHGDDKIGFAHSRIVKESESYIVFESAVMNLRAIGAVHRISTDIIGHLNQDASLRSFVFILDSGMIRFEARGKVEGQYLVLNTEFGGEMRESKIVLQEKPILSIGLWPHLVKSGLRVGDHYQRSLFDPTIMAQKPVEVRVIGQETIVLGGRKWEAYKVKTTFAGLEVLTWVGPNGERLKEEGLMGFRMVRTTEDEARLGIGSDPELDIAEAVSIPANMVLAEPRNLVYLKIRLDGVDPAGLDLDSGRQRLKGSILEVALESKEARYTDKTVQLKPHLKASLLIQSDHPTIKTLAGSIVGELNRKEAKARRILNWVHSSLDKRATVSVPNAIDTLEAKAGDCNEHAVLFAALARAAAIPAKVSVGLVYARGRFYYHAWNEVFLGEWITADALMGQMPADVTHIKFVEGDLDRQAEMVRVIGQVKLTVLEAR
ncbi:MAG: transglutaminase domain-containing protein [Desulfobacterales bacterium]|nr:MAG: transglutaminase domain-containing protein [Desulfobacterales bacterium]